MSNVTPVTTEKSYPVSRLPDGRAPRPLHNGHVGVIYCQDGLRLWAGIGLHVGFWEKLFSDASLHFCDISLVANENFGIKYPYMLIPIALSVTAVAPLMIGVKYPIETTLTIPNNSLQYVSAI
jgi:hypothetical protein